MAESVVQNWVKFLFGGIGVAAFTFAAPIVWERVSHRNLGPDQVETALRIDDGVLYLLVRNNSDDPLDLVEADIQIEGVADASEGLGAYPEPSHLYQVDSTSATQLSQQGGRLFVTMRIAQTIKPRHLDQFGLKISGPSGLLRPAPGSMTGTILDMKGDVYHIKY